MLVKCPICSFSRNSGVLIYNLYRWLYIPLLSKCTRSYTI
nr:MAG TPA: hypothetical protein [Bacteriophage sp.]